jgi:hypothetical protein
MNNLITCTNAPQKKLNTSSHGNWQQTILDCNNTNLPTATKLDSQQKEKNHLPKEQLETLNTKISTKT